MRDELRHLPVLLSTVLDVVSPAPGDVLLDVTLGLGGHASALLEAAGPTGTLIGLDADPRNLALARERLLPFGGRADLRHATFGDLPSLGLPPVDILLADLGLSSPHIDDPARGFSFRSEAPLDMRFNPERGVGAAAFLLQSEPQALADIFRTYGELPRAWTLAQELAGKDIPTTALLVQACERVYGWRTKHVLAQVFQALRIAVNDEMGALETLLQEGPRLLKPGGRMAVISYHSLEDRATKQTFRSLTTSEKDPLTGKISREAPFILLTPKPLRPSPEEVSTNPRSRSALLRAIRRR